MLLGSLMRSPPRLLTSLRHVGPRMEPNMNLAEREDFIGFPLLALIIGLD